MMQMGKKRLQTGLDVGSSSVKFVQLFGGHDNPSLVGFDIVKIAEGSGNTFAGALKKMAGRLSVKEVNISISGPSVIVRYVELPRMSEDELKSSMKFEAEKYIPFPINEVILDSQIIEQLGHGKMRVLLAAAKKSTITGRISLVESAGLSVRMIDCDSFALANAFLLNFHDINEANNSALLNIGDKLTTIDILKGRLAYFTRELEIGGRNFVKAISEQLSLDAKAASDLLEQPGERFEELMTIVRPVVTHMIDEIKLSLSYYENQTGLSVNNIYLSGGLFGFKGLTDILKEGLGAECQLWDPFKRVKIEKDVPQEKLDKVKHQLHVALGLAMRG